MFPIYLMITGVLSEFRVPFTQTAEHKKIFEEGVKTYAPKLKIVPCDKGVCAEALEDIDVKELIVSLPIAFKLTGLDSTPLIRPGVPENYRHFFNLLYYKFMDTSSSFLSAAIHSYPIEFDVPLNWTESDLDTFNSLSFYILQHEPHPIHREMCDYFNKNYDRAKYPRELFECESWKWAKMIFQTRAFQIDIKKFHKAGTYLDFKGGSLLTLIPILDSFNHDITRSSQHRKNFGYSAEPPSLLSFSIRKYTKGQEVFYYYDSHNSFDFMRFYGFVPMNNSEDSLRLTLERFVNCRGVYEQNECNYDLSVKELNKEFFTSLIDLRTETAPSESIPDSVEALAKKTSLDGMDEEEFEILYFAGRLYRLELVSLYLYIPSFSLREIRRNLAHQSTYRNIMIYQFAVVERKTFYESLKHVDRALLHLMHHSLF